MVYGMSEAALTRLAADIQNKAFTESPVYVGIDFAAEPDRTVFANFPKGLGKSGQAHIVLDSLAMIEDEEPKNTFHLRRHALGEDKLEIAERAPKTKQYGPKQSQNLRKWRR